MIEQMITVTVMNWREGLIGLSSIERANDFFSMSWIEPKTYSSIERSFTVHSPRYKSFVMGLPLVNTRLGEQYQLVFPL